MASIENAKSSQTFEEHCPYSGASPRLILKAKTPDPDSQEARVSITGRQFFRLLWGERTPILGGLALAAVLCSFSPQVWRARVLAFRWISEPSHVNFGASVAFLAVILAVATLVWPGPGIARWTKSWFRGVSPGSFALPAVGAILVFALGFLLPFWIWLAVAILTGLMVLVAIGFSICRSSSDGPTSDAADEPMRHLAEAWPQRRELARRIADCVMEDGKPTYAVYGEFGSGKSSMLNFIEESLKQSPGTAPIIVRFNGWLPGSQENLAEQLLGDIAAECRKKYFVPQLSRISSKVAKAVTKGIPHLDGIGDWFPKETQRDLIEGLRKMLDRVPLRVVVLVDEIDRMRKNELFVLLKLIRGFASLPHLSFICALERHHVEGLIREEFGAADHTFFHKFFAESFQLPRLFDSFLESEAHDRLVAVFDRHGWFVSDSAVKTTFSDSIRQLWGAILSPFCSNVRLVNRLVSAVRAEAGAIIGEVDPIDLTLVAALRCFAPAALDLCWRFRDTLCAQDSPSGVSEPNDTYALNVASYLSAEAQLDTGEPMLAHVRTVRKFLFSGLDKITDSQEPDSKAWINAVLRYFEANKQGTQTRRLRSAAYFAAYFQSALPIAIYSERNLTRIFDELGRSDDSQIDLTLRRELETLELNDERRLNFLEKFSGRAAQALDPGRCAQAARALVAFPGGLDAQFHEKECECVARLVLNISDELALSGRVEESHRLLQTCIENAVPDELAHRILTSARGKRPFPDAVIAMQRGVPITPDEVIERAFAKRMEVKYGPGVAVGQVDLNLSYWLAFNDWGIMLKKDVLWNTSRDLQHEFWKRYISSAERMADFARFVVAQFTLNAMRMTGPISIENLLKKEEILELARRFPPYVDEVAVAYIRELLGGDAIPEPVGFGAGKWTS
ncbi:hypothetical protein DYQ86_04860 [Acidobacteria bacterium AB60]|nr:hypothetical protein DYQ86_04860 [Acidobacteria bacterium AB60]